MGTVSSMPASRPPRIMVVAHRGACAYAPENTTAAFDLAVQLGADYIEFDLRVTRDGQLVVIHDETVSRTTNGVGRVDELTLREIRSLDAGSWFDPKFSGQRVPTFEEMLDRYHGRVGLLVELKGGTAHSEIADLVAATLRRRGADREPRGLIVQSFDRDLLLRSFEMLPGVPHGLLLHSSISAAELSEVARFARFANVDVGFLDRAFVDAAHRRRVAVWAWTVRDASSMRRALDAGVDGVITDYPDLRFPTNGGRQTP